MSYLGDWISPKASLMALGNKVEHGNRFAKHMC